MEDNKLSYWVYILTNKYNNVFYIGFTSNLNQRVVEHKMKLHNGFTKQYNVSKLVYFEHFTDVYFAIAKEKKMKKWNREWKVELINKSNPDFRDLLYDLITDNDIADMKAYIIEREKIKEIPDKSTRG